jgi:NTE family protein
MRAGYPRPHRGEADRSASSTRGPVRNGLLVQKATVLRGATIEAVGPTRVALSLGGGGARGYAHIGVIEVLEERGYEIVAVAGTSMGALVGGLHAAGRLPEYADWVGGLTQRDVLRLLDPAVRGPGAIRGDKVLGRVAELLAGARIEDLRIPYTAVATDLFARREVWFQRGPVDAAIRASVALPTVFPPVVLNGRLLVDGGLMNPVPLDPLASVRADAVVAVSLAGVSGARGRAPEEESTERRPTEEWLDRFRRTAGQVLDREQLRTLTRRIGVGHPYAAGEPSDDDAAADAAARSGSDTRGGDGTGPSGTPEAELPDRDRVFDSLPTGLSTLDVVDLSLDAMQDLVTRYRHATFPPDLVITVPKNACRTLDFHKAPSMVELGRRVADEALDAATDLPPPSPRPPG